jgi:hypothetical protein
MLDPYSVITPRAEGGFTFPYDLAEEARRLIWQEFECGLCRQPMPNVYYRSEEPKAIAYGMLPLTNAGWVI